MTSLRDRCGDLIASIEKLKHLIEAENSALAAIGDGATPAIDLEAKRELASIYAEHMKTVQDRLKAGDTMDRATSDLVDAAHTSLSGLLGKNRALLRRSHTATSRMVSLIVDTARETMPKEEPTYSSPEMRKPKVGRTDQPMALNVTL